MPGQVRGADVSCLVPAKEIPELITVGRIGHGPVVVVFSYYEHWQRKH